MKKGNVSINTFEASLSYTAMPDKPLYVFACCDADDSPTALASVRYVKFAIEKSNGETMELLPYKRNSDGVVGLLDVSSGTFYENNGSGVFLEGGSLSLPGGYSLIESVSFNEDKMFDLGVFSNTDSIDIQYKRDYTSSSKYLYGVINDGNTASVTAYLATNGAWRFGNQLVRPNTGDKNVHKTTISDVEATHDCSELVANKSIEFMTLGSVILGGYRDATGAIDLQYIGKVFYVRKNDGKTLDWIPCMNANGVEGFWDCVTQSFVEPM